MKKLNITKEQFNRSRYFQRKYGKLEYVSESGKMFKTNKGKVLMFNENIHRPDVEDLDVPVTEEEEVLARYIEQCIQEELGIGSSCETHNPGEEMHIEIFIGEDEYDEDTDLNELCNDLEELVNQIGKQEKQDSGTEWGDARFSPQGDYIYGEVWPLEGEYAINPKGELARESTRKARRSARRFNENRVSQGTGNKELDKLIRFNSKVNSIHDQLEKLVSKYWSDAENDPDMETYIDLLEEAEQKLLRVSVDLYERIHMG